MKHPFVKVSFSTVVKDVKETIDKIIAEPEPFTPSSTLSPSNWTPSVDTAAQRMYASHLMNVGTYQKKNPEKMREKSKRYLDKLKLDEAKYKDFLAKRREYYKNVLKPRKQQKLDLIHESKKTTLVI